MKKTREVQPCGMLYSNRREYFLLKPYPIVGDSWEKDNAYRFLVVPNAQINKYDMSDELQLDCPVYSYARHIVTTNFTADYVRDMPKITILDAGELDIDNLPSFQENNQ